MSKKPIIKSLKVSIIGDQQSGKSSLINTYTKNSFSSSYDPTIGAVFNKISFKFSKMQIDLYIWDVSGQDRYFSLLPLYIKETDINLIVFDKSDRKSFDKVEDFIEELNRYNNLMKVNLLVGNKSDLESEVSFDEALEKALRLGMCYIEISAKSGYMVETLFQVIACYSLLCD